MKLVPSCTAADAGGGREGCWGMNQRGKARQTSQNDPDFPASGPWSWVPAAEPFLGFTGSGKKKQENRGKGEGDERQGRAKGQMGKRGEPEGAASLGDGWRRRPLACSMQTPPARLAGYTGVPNSPKSKPRASPCELCVLRPCVWSLSVLQNEPAQLQGAPEHLGAGGCRWVAWPTARVAPCHVLGCSHPCRTLSSTSTSLALAAFSPAMPLTGGEDVE